MFQGSIAALITPFLSSEKIDIPSFRNLIDWHIEEKTDALVVCGTTGESPTLSQKEQGELFFAAIKASKKRIPIIAGTGCCDTKKTVQMTSQAKEMGADACLVTFPYYSRPTFEGCVAHFTEVAQVRLPVILYYHPGRTGLTLSPKQLAEISQIPGVVNIKEASGDVDFAMEVMRYTTTPVLSGDDSLALPLIAAGAKGVISIIANVIPKQWKEFIDKALSGDIKAARDLYNLYGRLCRSLVMETNPQGVKYAMSILKKSQSLLRLPLLEPKPAVKEEIAKALHAIIWEPTKVKPEIIQQVFQTK